MSISALWAKFGIPACLVLLGILIFVTFDSCYQNGKREEKSKEDAKTLASTIVTLGATQDSLREAQKPIAAVIESIPKYIVKIRTVVLAPVDSAWKIADSMIALAPASDSACHKAYNTLKTSCELLRQQVVADTVKYRMIQGDLITANNKISNVLPALDKANKDLADVKKAYQCTYIFGIPCMTRTESFGVGAVLMFILKSTVIK